MQPKSYNPSSNLLLTIGQTILLYASFILFFLLSLVEVRYPLLGSVQIYFYLMILFYWGLNRPASLPLLVSFLFGLAVDFIEAGPIGLNALLFMGLQWLVVDQRKFLRVQSFPVVWLGLTSLLAGYVFLKTAFFSLYYWDMQFSVHLWYSALISAIIFPVVNIVLNAIHRIVSYQPVRSSFRLGD
ncbi:MAG: rod shape-determining protein MreD [Pseudomonadota bacterium]